MHQKIEYLKQQIECRYHQPCTWCQILCRDSLGNELFEQRYSGNQLADKLQKMRKFQPERQGIYHEIESLMPEHEVYQFISLIDQGFTLLALDSQSLRDNQWGHQLDSVIRKLQAVIRENETMRDSPLTISVKPAWMLNPLFFWAAKQKKGRPEDVYEKYLMYQFFAALLKATNNKTKVCTIVRKVCRCFYGQYKSFEVLYKRHLPGLLELKSEK